MNHDPQQPVDAFDDESTDADDNGIAEHDADDARLRQVRAKRAAMTRTETRRGRDWSLIGAIVLALSGLQLIFLAFQKWRTENYLAVLIFCILTAMAFAAATLLYRRYRRFAAAAQRL